MKYSRPLTHCFFVTGMVVATGVLSPASARAEDAAPAPASAPPASPARKLFADGKKLAADGKFAEACPKFEESLRLEVGVGTQFNLADCWEHIGRLASAHALFIGAAASAKAAGQSEREQVLRDRAAALEPRLSRLVIEVKSADPKLRVKRDDVPVEADGFGKAVPLDPGKYTIKARAPGKKDWEKVVELGGTTAITTVEIPELEPEKKLADVKPAAAPSETNLAPASKSAPMSSEADRPSSTNYRALAVAGVGVVSIGFGAVMGFKYLSANGDAKDICPSSRGCSIKQIQEHDRLVADARGDRRWSYAGFGFGGAFMLGAGALWYLQRSPSKSSTAIRAVPVVSADGSVGALVGGRF